MDNTPAAKEKGRTDAMQIQVSATVVVEVVCDHTIELHDQHGQIRGSWKGEETAHGIRYSCRHCGKFYGYQPNKDSEEAMYRAYLEQQRRLNCPGCGESPFVG